MIRTAAVTLLVLFTVALLSPPAADLPFVLLAGGYRGLLYLRKR